MAQNELHELQEQTQAGFQRQDKPFLSGYFFSTVSLKKPLMRILL